MERLKNILLQLNPFAAKDKPPAIVLLGAPGSGKGTLAVKLAKVLNMPTISTGDLVRAELASGSELGTSIRQVVKSGGLVSDELILSLLCKRLTEPDTRNGVILDGFPRTITQAQALDAHVNVIIALELYLDYDIITQLIGGRRCCPKCNAVYNVADITVNGVKWETINPKQNGLCDHCNTTLIQREDDTADTIRTRLQLYDKEAPQIIEYYKSKSIHVRYPIQRKGNTDLEQVTKIIKNKQLVA